MRALHCLSTAILLSSAQVASAAPITWVESIDATQHLGDALIAGAGPILPALAAGTIYGAPGFVSPLAAGTYTFWIQETSTRSDYTLAFTVVPEPSSALLLGVGLALAAGRRAKHERNPRS